MDRLRLGVIGTGSVVREIYQHLYFHSEFSPFLAIEAACDPNRQALDDFGDRHEIPPSRRFADYREMIRQVPLDAVQVNTPDHLHAEPTVAALEAGLDVLVPKPTAATLRDAHRMIGAARRTGRVLAIDFHKRQDPRIREAAARYRKGRYGEFQVAVWHMLDKLFVADPNHVPRFFASPDFAHTNTPISFLTVHMADAFMQIVDLRPVSVRATGYKQKLPSLTPIPVDGYDLVDTEIGFENGGVAHIITGWHLPNTAHATTVQDARIICRDGMLDLGIDRPGCRELTPDGIVEVNPLFRNFDESGQVSGYGISSPGKLLRAIQLARHGALPAAERERLQTPAALGFYTALVIEGAETSLRQGTEARPGVITGPPIDLIALTRAQLGDAAAREYMPVPD